MQTIMCNKSVTQISLVYLVNEIDHFLCALEKVGKATISVVISVCLSVSLIQVGSYWKDYH